MPYITIALKHNSQCLVVKGDYLNINDNASSLIIRPDMQRASRTHFSMAFLEQHNGQWSPATAGEVKELEIRMENILWWAKSTEESKPLFPL